MSRPGSCGFVSQHHDESGWERWLSVQLLRQQLRPEGQNGEGERLHHHRPLPGTGLIHRGMTTVLADVVEDGWTVVDVAE